MRPKEKITVPTQEEIAEQLAGLNRSQKSLPISSDAERARAKALRNYQNWFTRRKIAIYQDKSSVWKLGEVLDDIGVRQEL